MATTVINERILRKAIQKILSSRERSGYWVDSEEEDPQETMVYKGQEAFKLILIVKKHFPQLLGTFKFDDKFIIDEIKYLYDNYKEEGFFPSPYSFTRENYDIIDFASHCVCVVSEVLPLTRKDFFSKVKKTPKKEIQKSLLEMLKDALRFIKDSSFSDKHGTCWEGIYGEKRKKPSFPNVYFTSHAIKALSKAVNSEELHLTNEEKEGYIKLIKQGVHWIFQCEKDALITADIKKTRSEVNFGVYAFLGIFDVWKYLDASQQEKATALFENLLNYFKNNLDSLITQSSFQVLLPEAKKPSYYEDRISKGHVLSVLCRGKDILKDASFINEEYDNLVTNVLRIVLDEGNLNEGYWQKDNYYLHYTCDCIIGLLDYESYGTVVEYTFNETDILQALNNTLKRAEIRNMFLSELNKIQVKKQLKEFKGN